MTYKHLLDSLTALHLHLLAETNVNSITESGGRVTIVAEPKGTYVHLLEEEIERLKCDTRNLRCQIKRPNKPKAI